MIPKRLVEAIERSIQLDKPVFIQEVIDFG
jgi:hypothetical protein